MNLPRFPGTSGRGRTAATVSLDDLVEETGGGVGGSRQAAASGTDEEDELDAYMASLEGTAQDEHTAKKVKIEPPKQQQSPPPIVADSDDEELKGGNLEQIEETAIAGSQQELNVDAIQAEVQAAMASVNAPTNKTMNRLDKLVTRSVEYLPFKKDFYQEVAELAAMSKEEVAELRMALENITVRGKSCPKPVTCWAHCGLSRKVMEVLKKSHYLTPTPIQAQAIPAIMCGRDVLGIAKTGCGKTLSFLLPMFRHILAQPKLERNDGPIALIITPTRELATQICDDALKFTRSLGLRVVAIYGGPNISEQIGMLKPGAEIVVCTPGRMIEMLTVNSGRVTNLNRCTYMVLDEADRLFDMGFEKQIRSIVNLIRPDRQTVMFSATFPAILDAHARKLLTRPIIVRVGDRSIVCEDVTQSVEIIEEDDKFPRLLEIFIKHVDQEHSAIVFVSKQEKGDSLLKDLMEHYDPNCLSLHGGNDKDDRISSFDKFRKGKARVLVATSLAARGLDVKNCICVVNYDCPNHYEDYVHRCGRTGRAGNKGFAYTFVTPHQGPYAANIIKALELSKQVVPRDLQELWDAYEADAKATGKKIWTSSGFSGKGFKFDAAESALITEKKKHQKKSLGANDSSDDDDDQADGLDGSRAGKDIDLATLESHVRNLAGTSSKDDNSRASLRTIPPAAAAASAAPKRGAVAGVQPQPGALAPASSNGTSAPEGSSSSTGLSKLELVRQRAAMICQKKKLEPVGGGGSGGEPVAATIRAPATVESVADQRAQDMRERLSAAAAEGAAAPTTASLELNDTSGPAPTPNPSSRERLEKSMTINDYHQQVRRRLTSKDTLNKVSEQCEVGITVRGRYCPPGDRPSEPKLYLAIEGTTLDNIDRAYKELLLVVKDEYERIGSQPSRGRFKL